MDPYVQADEVLESIGGSENIRPADYDRATTAATSQIDRWTGRRFLQDAVASVRKVRATDCERVCVGDYDDPTTMVVETDDLGDGTWSEWDPSEWQPEADDRGNGPFVRLDGEPWRWIATTGARKFPTSGRLARVRATNRWGWVDPPWPVLQAGMKLSILYSQNRDQDPTTTDETAVMVAQGLLMDYAVEGGTLYCRPLVG